MGPASDVDLLQAGRFPALVLCRVKGVLSPLDLNPEAEDVFVACLFALAERASPRIVSAHLLV
jgi:hypothetical protein